MINLYIVSDSTGETANQYADALMIQFPKAEFRKKTFSNVDTLDKLQNVYELFEESGVIIMTVVIENVAQSLKEFAIKKNLKIIDILCEPIRIMEEITGQKAARLPGMMRDLNRHYFNKMEALEFAMTFDDGKNPKGLLKADIVLVGVSRTSKTPLSVFLANKNYKVANLPLVPEVDLPDEIFKVDKKKIIGLIIDHEKLNEIRNQRLKALGLSSESEYARDERITHELEYAKSVFEKLDCKVINVSGSTIEETSAKILEYIEG
ncbi:MAG: pyruvate, water dikinase regulatory protein [Tissierellia bacterium]|nr:pyruvate, water dikinase regulatory protein [Tissierellia bacterium]